MNFQYNGGRTARIVFTVLTLSVLFAFPATRACAETGIVTVGVYENEPKVFTDETGRPAGIFIDIIEYIAGLEGWDLRYRAVTWAEGLDRVSAGEIDLMPDVAYTATRDELFDYHTEPVLSDWFQVYARVSSDIKSIVDLEGKRVFVLERSVQQETFGQLIGDFGLDVTVIPLPDYETIFDQVAVGNGDAAITNRFYGTVHAEEHGLKDTAIVFNPTKLFFATMEGSSASVLRAIDRRLVSMKKDRESVYYRSLERWTTETVPFTLPVWVKIAGLVAGVVLLISLVADVVEVTADRRRLEQIIINLLNNAVKFTENGRVLVTCRTEDDRYLVSVTDTGIGISPKDISNLFTPFHQIDTGTSRTHEGTGLGLAICKKLITMMGGTIDVRSTPGKGSTFTVRFPAGPKEVL